jgi:hypothetical protein
MWEPRRLKTPRAFTSCYKDSFTFLPLCLAELPLGAMEEACRRCRVWSFILFIISIESSYVRVLFLFWIDSEQAYTHDRYKGPLYLHYENIKKSSCASYKSFFLGSRSLFKYFIGTKHKQFEKYWTTEGETRILYCLLIYATDICGPGVETIKPDKQWIFFWLSCFPIRWHNS